MTETKSSKLPHDMGTSQDWQGDYQENIALSSRPVFSIRAKLTLSFSLIFALCTIITLWSIYALKEIQVKIYFLEISGNYMSEIQEARRFEKNFLLYRTNLDDALAHVQSAEKILEVESKTIQAILGQKNYDIMLNQLNQYQRLLYMVGEAPDEPHERDLETELREYGGKMVSFAHKFVAKERESVHKTLSLARKIPFFFLAILIILIIIITWFLVRGILASLTRAMEYTKRIGEGDFTPIMPRRKYRDEFSQLAIAFNRMIHELDKRHRILVESHKLRAIGTLVAGVAHELNNPLNNTMLTAAMLEEDLEELSHEEKMELIQDILKETERSQKIVRNLLDFARAKEYKKVPLSIKKIIDDSINLVMNKVKIAKVNLTKEVPEDLPPIHGDEQALAQVFINLILNAVDAMPQRGQITISATKSKSDGFVKVDVKDNGPGIPEHIQTRIFDPFFTTKAREKGTGLGLSVSQGIVRKLGGYIEVKSDVGVGTTFSVMLPTTEVPSSISIG